MPKSPNQKNRLLVLERIFLQETDELHALTLRQLQAKLQAHDIKAERKTLYADFECLTQAGIEILRDEHDRYYTESRLFETAELKLLSDAVASSRFLTEKKSQALIGKLQTFITEHYYTCTKQILRGLGQLDAPSLLLWTVIYSGFAMVGLLIAALLCFAFKKEDDEK